ncbi:MAG: methyltransferase domain-containing protein [Alphaproteobacteria bacterium]|nr:methyltransferase domain-containing protein [Alphaproteobacteria bacterium]
MTLPLQNSPFGAGTQKYWERRHSLFSKWDEGVLSDEEGLYSVKPEAFALEIAQTLSGSLVLDAFCGIGGSAIGFARRGKRVVSVDCDANRLRMAKRNAELYGVADKIDFAHGDILALYDSLCAAHDFDALHIDPPWGGPDYYLKPSFGWSDFSPNPLPLIKKALQARLNVAVGLPANFAQEELQKIPGKVRITEARDQTRVLFSTAYIAQ